MRCTLVAATFVLFTPLLAAKSWEEIRPGIETKPILLVIGHPTSIRWDPPEHPGFVQVVIDRDVHPRVAEAYERFAAIMGEAGDPVYVVLSPYLEPVAAATADNVKSFLDTVAADWNTKRVEIKDAAALAVRRYLIANPKLAALPEPSPHFDPIGGGFFRSVNDFDKVLADQVDYVLSDAPPYAIRATLDYVLDELLQPSGMFVAGQEAESIVAGDTGPLTIEGGHYKWRPEEIHQILGVRDGDIAMFHFVMPYLRAPRDAGETRIQFSLSAADLDAKLAEARVRLLERRRKRPDPRLHLPVITELNARLISAFARVGIESGDQRYVDAANRGIRALLARNFKSGKLLRADGVPALPEDWSATIRALLDVYELSFDLKLLERAVELQRLADLAPPPALPDPVAHLVTPRADAVAKENLVRLAAITGDERWKERAGHSFAGHRQIIIAGSVGGEATSALLQAARATAGDRMIFLVSSKRVRTVLGAWMPYVKDILEIENQPVAAVCVERRCSTPSVKPPL